MDTNKARKRFIEDWTDTVLKQAGVNFRDKIAMAYVELTVSQIMDSAIKFKDVLDIGHDDGYEINL